MLASSGWELWSISAAPGRLGGDTAGGEPPLLCPSGPRCGERASELKEAAGAGEAASSCELKGRQQQGGGAGKDIALGAAAPA